MILNVHLLVEAVKSVHMKSWENFILISSLFKILVGLFILTRFILDNAWRQD